MRLHSSRLVSSCSGHVRSQLASRQTVTYTISSDELASCYPIKPRASSHPIPIQPTLFHSTGQNSHIPHFRFSFSSQRYLLRPPWFMSDQFIPGACYAVLNRPHDLALRKRGPAPIAHGPVLEPVAHLANIHHALPEQLVVLYQIPRRARAHQSLARSGGNLNAMGDGLVHGCGVGAREGFVEGRRRICLRAWDGRVGRGR